MWNYYTAFLNGKYSNTTYISKIRPESKIPRTPDKTKKQIPRKNTSGNTGTLVPVFRVLTNSTLKIRRTAPKNTTLKSPTKMSGLWNFSIRVQSRSVKIESDPVLPAKFLKIISQIQPWSAHAKPSIFSSHHTKTPLELFCL